MAKKNLSRLIASLESEDGTAVPVDANNPEASLNKETELGVGEHEAVKQTNDVDDAVDAGGKDYTAIDEDSYRQGEKIAKQIERLSEAGASTEAYIGILRANRAQGVDKHTAAVIAQDLRSQYPKFFAKTVASLEAIDDNEQLRIGNSNDAEKGASGNLEKIKAKAKEAIAKFVEMVKAAAAKVRELVSRLREFLKGFRAKKEVMSAVIKNLPAPGQPFKPVALLTNTAGVKSAEAMKAAIESKAVAPEPPKTVKIDATNLIAKDGKIDLYDSSEAKKIIDFHTAYLKAIPAAFDAMRKHIDSMVANPREGLFDNDGDKAAIDEVLNNTVRKVQIPEGATAMGEFTTEGASVYRFQEKSEGEPIEMPLMSKEDANKANDAVADLMDGVDDFVEPQNAANEAFVKFGEYLDGIKEKVSFSMALFTMFPVHVRAGTSFLPAMIQRHIQQRLWAIDAHMRARIQAQSEATADRINKLNEE